MCASLESFIIHFVTLDININKFLLEFELIIVKNQDTYPGAIVLARKEKKKEKDTKGKRKDKQSISFQFAINLAR
jgi:hypothetical protein